MSTGPNAQLAVVGRSYCGRPSTYRLQRPATSASREAAYRRLAVTILGVDVRSLAIELEAKRDELFMRGNSAA